MIRVQFHVEGIVPVMFHNERLADVEDPFSVRIKKITSKRGKKTETDRAELARLEWEGGLYYDEKIGPYVPTRMVLACIREGAKKTSDSKDVVRGVIVQTVSGFGDKIPLKYDGPRELEKMWESDRFSDRRLVRVEKKKIKRVRPVFNPPWSIEFCALYNEDIIESAKKLADLVRTAFRCEGIGDYRQLFGRGESEMRDVHEMKEVA